MIRAVIFDCDGVLVDSERLTNRVIRDNLAQRGLDWPVERIMTSFVGGTVAGVGEVARASGARIESGWLDTIYAEIYAVLEQEVTPIPGAVDLLDWLDARAIPYAIGSNGPERKMQITLARCGFADRLQGRVLSAVALGAPKPAPDVYLAAAELLGVAPEHAVVVEDSPTGARAAQAARMACYGFAPDDDGAGLSAVGAMPFHAMRDLQHLLPI